MEVVPWRGWPPLPIYVKRAKVGALFIRQFCQFSLQRLPLLFHDLDGLVAKRGETFRRISAKPRFLERVQAGLVNHRGEHETCDGPYGSTDGAKYGPGRSISRYARYRGASRLAQPFGDCFGGDVPLGIFANDCTGFQ